MSYRGILVAVLLLLSACAVGERPYLLEEGEGTVRPGGLADDVLDDAPENVRPGAAEALTSTPGPVDGDDETADLLGDGPPVVITPTGVMVLVDGVQDDGSLAVRTPCGNEQLLLWGQPVEPVQIMLDAGHGGDERGAIGPSGETEAELNLDIVRRTAAILDLEGYNVGLTRTADYRVPISYRAELADRLGASVLVSVHHNSPTPDLRLEAGPGTEVYVQVGNEESERLGSLIHAEIFDSLAVFDAEWAGTSKAGVLNVINTEGDDAYGINRYPETVAVLAELAYLSNPTEAVLLGTDEYRQTAAEALARAIGGYLAGEGGGTPVQDEPRLFTSAGGTGGLEGCVDPVLE